jgi:hypothetical protein
MVSRGDVDQESSKPEDTYGQQQGTKHSQYTKNKPHEQEENPVKAVEAEEADSVSLEVAFAYRARPAARELSSKAKNAHLFLAIDLRAGIRLHEYHSSLFLDFWHLAYPLMTKFILPSLTCILDCLQTTNVCLIS